MDLSNFISGMSDRIGWITCAAIATSIAGLTARNGFERLRGRLASSVEEPRLANGRAQIVTIGRSGLALGWATAAAHEISATTAAVTALPKASGALPSDQDGARYLAVPYPLDDKSGLVFYRLIPLG